MASWWEASRSEAGRVLGRSKRRSADITYIPLRQGHLYRVAQEALANVARHAQASRVEASIQRRPKAVSMEIKDNGKSFDVERLLSGGKSRRMGLLGMRERVEMLGGKFTIESAPGTGTTSKAQIPFRNGA